MAEAVYCIDTSAMIDLNKYYPLKLSVFQGLWGGLSELVSVDRLIAPEQVLVELEHKDDEIYRWAKAHKHMFKALDPQQTKLSTAIIAKFPGLIDPSKSKPDADPFVVALAVATNDDRRKRGTLFGEKKECIVVTHEIPRQGKVKIPDVCQHYEIACIRLLDLFEKENW